MTTIVTIVTIDNVDWNRVKDGLGSWLDPKAPYTVGQLKQLACSLNINQKGTKADLLERLEPYRDIV